MLARVMRLPARVRPLRDGNRRGRYQEARVQSAPYEQGGSPAWWLANCGTTEGRPPPRAARLGHCKHCIIEPHSRLPEDRKR